MQYILQLFQQNRRNIGELLKEHSLTQANTIPQGFNNNLIWNAGHILVSQQFLLYHFSGLTMPEFVQVLAPKYGANTSPTVEASQTEMNLIVTELIKSSEKLVEDYKNDVFKSYEKYTSKYFGITMKNIDEAISFNTFHEGYHFGFMRAITKNV